MEKMNMDDLGNVSGGFFTAMSDGNSLCKKVFTIIVEPGEKLVDIIPNIPKRYRDGASEKLGDFTNEFGQITEGKVLTFVIMNDDSVYVESNNA